MITDVRFQPEFTVLDEADGWIVVDKPAPLQVHPKVPGGAPTLLDGLRDLLAFELANGAALSIINRLDRETSGVVIVAKDRETARALHGAMEGRRVSKEYLSLVWGWPRDDAWTVEAPIGRLGAFTPDPVPVWVRRGIHPEGAPARTRFEVVRRVTRETSAGDRFALVRAMPATGRTHQIRVHLAHSGHPIVGDKLYGPPGERTYLEFIATGWTPALARDLLLRRQALHCRRMAVPGFGAWEAPIPPVFDWH